MVKHDVKTTEEAISVFSHQIEDHINSNQLTIPPPDQSDLGALSGEAIISHCEDAAKTVENSGKEVDQIAREHIEFCNRVAAGIRTAGAEMAKEATRIARKARAAADGARRIADEFMLEQSDDEAPKTQTK